MEEKSSDKLIKEKEKMLSLWAKCCINVIFEYHILREVIFQDLENDGQLTQIERDIILNAIEQAVNDAALKSFRVMV